MKQLVKRIARRAGIGLYRTGNEYGLLETAHLRRFLDVFGVDCVFDVGANEGQYARRLRELGYRGTILSFEPHPEVFQTLRVAAAGDPAWWVYELALDAEVRDLEFNLMVSTQFSSLHAPSSADTHLFDDINKVARRVSVTTATLDRLYPDLRKEHGFEQPYLKLDTQGHDTAVVKGGLTVIDRFCGLQSEMAITRLYQDAPDFTESLAYYRSLGFELSSIVPNNAGHFPALVEVDCIMYRPELARR